MTSCRVNSTALISSGGKGRGSLWSVEIRTEEYTELNSLRVYAWLQCAAAAHHNPSSGNIEWCRQEIGSQGLMLRTSSDGCAARGRGHVANACVALGALQLVPSADQSRRRRQCRQMSSSSLALTLEQRATVAGGITPTRNLLHSRRRMVIYVHGGVQVWSSGMPGAVIQAVI